MIDFSVTYTSLSGSPKRIPLRIVLTIALVLCACVLGIVVGLYSHSKHEEVDHITVVFDELKDSVDKIPKNKRVSQIQEQVSYSADTLKRCLQAIESHDTGVHQFTSTLASVPPALAPFSGTDPEMVLSGSLEIITAFWGLLRIAMKFGERGELVIKLMSQVFNIILALCGASGTDMVEVVQYAIKEALDEYHEHEIQIEAAGLGEAYTTAWTFLDGLRVRNAPLTTTDISAIHSNVPITLGVEFIGKLAAEIGTSCHQSAERPTDGALHSAQSCIRYCRLYYQLVLLELLVRVDEYSLVKATDLDDPVADGILAVVEGHIGRVRPVIGFLHEPGNDTVLPAVLFDQKNDAAMKKFMSLCGIPVPVGLPGLENHWVSINTTSGPTSHFPKQRDCHHDPTTGGSNVNISSDVVKIGRVDMNFWTLQVKTDATYGKENKAATFFHKLVGHTYQNLHDQWYLTMDNDRTGPLSTHETAGCDTYCSHFTIIKLKSNGPYMIASRKWPEKFVYVSSAGCLYSSGSGDPGPAGYFQLTDVNPGDK